MIVDMNGDMTPDLWRDRVGIHMERRREELDNMSKRAAARRAGFSEVTWRQLESGRRQIAQGLFVAPTPEPRTRHAACRALGWTIDSIDRLLEGEEPEIDATAPKPIDDGDDLLQILNAGIEQLRQQNTALRELVVGSVAQLNSRIDAVEQLARRRRLSTPSPTTQAEPPSRG